MLAGLDARVVKIPQLRPLVARVPLASRDAKGKHALLGSRSLLIAPRATDRRLTTARAQPIQESLGLEGPATALRPPGVGSGPGVERRPIGVDDQFDPDRGRKLIAELDHFTELIARIDMQERKRNRARVEGLLA